MLFSLLRVCASGCKTLSWGIPVKMSWTFLVLALSQSSTALLSTRTGHLTCACVDEDFNYGHGTESHDLLLWNVHYKPARHFFTSLPEFVLWQSLNLFESSLRHLSFNCEVIFIGLMDIFSLANSMCFRRLLSYWIYSECHQHMECSQRLPIKTSYFSSSHY